MRRYCKAYHLRDLRQFKGWKEIAEESEPELTDESICYLWDDFTVVRSPVQAKGIIFNEVTADWQTFCQEELHFSIPEDIQRADQSEVVEATKEPQNI